MKIIFFAFCLLITISVVAQKKNRHTPVIQQGWFLSLNPHAIFEPEQGAVGLGIGYRLNDHIELWTEMNYLYRGFFQDPGDFTNLQGIRSSTSLKYYYSKKHGFFAGVEFRVKKYSFMDQTDFENLQTNQVLNNFRYKASHTLIGGGAFWGKRFKVTPNGKFELEGNIGIGVKHRMIDRKNVPAGYSKIEYSLRRISPLPDYDNEQTLPYFPAIFRLIYHL